MTPREAIYRVREKWKDMSEAERIHWLTVAMRLREWMVLSLLRGRRAETEEESGLVDLYSEILAQAATLTPKDGVPYEVFREFFA